jgi:hypothetical protein
MTLPRTSNGRLRSENTSNHRDLESREVKPPELFVRIPGAGYYGAKYAQARIRIRKGCYQYLVWRDGEKTRELYLGKRDNRTLRPRSPAPARAARPGAGARARVRGTK